MEWTTVRPFLFKVMAVYCSCSGIVSPTIAHAAFNCSFDVDLCGWIQDSDDQFDWTLKSGETPTLNTGPLTDHTTGAGQYIYIETSSPRVVDDKARLISPTLHVMGNETKCFRFFYHMDGADIGSLHIYVSKENEALKSPLLSVAKEQGDYWKIGQINITRPDTDSFVVTIEGVRGTGAEGNIAIDDVMMLFGVCPKACGGYFNADYGTFTSPNYPVEYSSDLDCEYVITGESGKIVIVIFDDFTVDTSDNGTCHYDKVDIFDGNSTLAPSLGTFCGSNIPGYVKSTTSSMFVRFTSVGTISSTGFSAVYVIYQECTDGQCVNSSSNECGGFFNTTNGTFASPNYPSEYSNNLDCDYVISVEPGFNVKVMFQDFNLELSDECRYDKVAIYDGNSTLAPSLGSFCGSDIPGTVRSTGSNMLVTFTTDNTINYFGFSAVFRIDPACLEENCASSPPKECGRRNYSETSGYFASPNYPKEYSNNIVCEYLITVDSGKTLELIFDDFSLEKSDTGMCEYDKVAIFDGRSTNATSMGEYCGIDRPDNIRSTKNNMLIRFTSDRSLTYSGFSAVYALAQDCLTGLCSGSSSNGSTCLLPVSSKSCIRNRRDAYTCSLRSEWDDISTLRCITPQDTVIHSSRQVDQLSVDFLNIQGNRIRTLKRGVFSGLSKLFILDLQNNSINHLENGTFSELTRLNYLHLQNNNITSLMPGVFAGLSRLSWLDLHDNKIVTFLPEAFSGLGNLQVLNVSNNRINILQTGAFPGYTPSLQQLDLTNNGIILVQGAVFTNASHLSKWNLDRNNLTLLKPEIFANTTHLVELYLQHNMIVTIQRKVFSNLSQLVVLNISMNSITALRNGTFWGLSGLRYLDVSYNQITVIEGSAFKGLKNLEYLFFMGLELPTAVHINTFKGLLSLRGVSTSDNRLCCLVEKTYNESTVCTRTSQSSPLETCGTLFPNSALRQLGWTISLLAIGGNVLALLLRLCYGKVRTSKVQNRLIISLTVADFIMGVYMIIITSADIYYADLYYLSAWKSSDMCSFAGFLAIVSSESSVLTLTIITADRLICIVFLTKPQYKISPKMASILIFIVWMSIALLSAILVSMSKYKPEVYGFTDVCIGLPLHVETGGVGRLLINGSGYWDYQVIYQESDSGVVRTPWWFSPVIFIGVNGVSFIFIFVSYILIFNKMKRSSANIRNTASEGREMKAAIRMAFIVMTDFLCWMPVVIMGILSQSHLVTIGTDMYAWTAILIIPINSAINPFLYTFLVYYDIMKKKLCPKPDTSQQSGPRIQSTEVSLLSGGDGMNQNVPGEKQKLAIGGNNAGEAIRSDDTGEGAVLRVENDNECQDQIQVSTKKRETLTGRGCNTVSCETVL